MAFHSETEELLGAIREHEPGAPAIIDAASGRTLTYGQLVARVEQVAEELSARKVSRIHFLFSANEPDSIITYLACLRAGTPVCLLDKSRPDAARRILETYRGVILAPAGIPVPNGYTRTGLLSTDFVVYDGPGDPPVIHPRLALLLTTSGSTGDPKLVRLTGRNLAANAFAISEYLQLTPAERSIQSLPMYYSYGLSLIHSHLAAGGAIVLTPHSFLRPEFWDDFRAAACTSFAGVPHMYEALKRLKFDPAQQPSLKAMTQAGGKLSESTIEWYWRSTVRSGRRFFVMYGQTEATARISYVPPEHLEKKIGSIGIPIPGGKLSLLPVSDDGLQEIVYQGPNVMMGYVDGPEALGRGDDLGGVLHTGDLGRVDEDGYFYIVGRLKRFAKLFGKRINLADVESSLEAAYPVRAASLDSGHDRLLIFLECNSDFDDKHLVMELAKELSIPPSAIVLRRVDALPMTSSGKKDYATIARM